MALLAGLILIFGFVILIVGIFNPKVLFWDKNPTRAKVFGYWAISLFLGFGLPFVEKYNNENRNNGANERSAYEMMEVAFEGYPSEDEIKPMMESVMKRYDIQVNEENLQRVASMLGTLRKNSKVGVTEMEILKHIYQNGYDKISLSDQAGISATQLELTK